MIRNTTNGRVLLVASRDIPAFLNRQQAQLRLGLHPNRELQTDWKALGEPAFAFEVVDTLTPRDDPAWDPADDLRALEQLWLEKLAPWAPAGYHPAPPPERAGR